MLIQHIQQDGILMSLVIQFIVLFNVMILTEYRVTMLLICVCHRYYL